MPVNVTAPYATFNGAGASVVGVNEGAVVESYSSAVLPLIQL